MADVVHEFSSNTNLGYSDIAGDGVTIASTTGSQTAVVRDIAVEVGGEKKIDFKVDGVKVATSDGSASLSGTLILKSSQNLKMCSGETPFWTGMWSNFASNNDNNSSVDNSHWDLSKQSDYFNAPSGDSRVSFSSRQDKAIRGQEASVVNLTNGSVQGTGSKITCWPADHMFRKPEGDLYYTSYRYYSNGNNGYNTLNYYDRSADSVTRLMDSDTSYRSWESGFSNKYILLRSTGNMTQYKLLDTTDNSISSAITCKNANNNSGISIGLNQDNHNMSMLDDYCAFKTYMNSSGRLYFIQLSTGKSIYWELDSGWNETSKPNYNNSSGASSQSFCQLCKNSSGVYYLLWPYYNTNSQNTSSQSQGYGLTVWNCGTDLSSWFGGSYYANPAGLLTRECIWQPSGSGSDGLDEIDYRGFRIYDSSSWTSSWGSGYFPLKQLSQTDSSSRYWMWMNNEWCYMVDLDNVSSTPSDFIQQIRFTEGGSDVDILPGQIDAMFSMTPKFSASALAGSFGTIKARVSGILTT